MPSDQTTAPTAVARADATARARGRCHVRRRQLLGGGGAPQGPGPRCRRRDAAALRPWCRDGAPWRLLRRPGYPRCPPRRRQARHPPLRPRLRAALPDRRHAGLRRQLCGRRDAHTLRHMQPAHQVPRPAGDRPGARRRARWPPATTSSGATAPAAPSSTAPAMPTATRATSCSPPRGRSSTG